MDIILYNSTAEPNLLDKSSKLGTGVTLSGNLRESTALLSPSLLVESSTFLYFNYCYIPDFNRYYFIQSIELHSKNLYRLNLNIDVLFTYKDKIKDLSGIVSRNENTYNDLIKDDRITFTNHTVMQYATVTNTEDCEVFETDINPYPHDVTVYPYNYVVSTISTPQVAA